MRTFPGSVAQGLHLWVWAAEVERPRLLGKAIGTIDWTGSSF